MAKIPGVDIRYAKTLTGQEGISFQETAEGYEVECGNIGTDALPLIVELKASRKLSPQDILRNENNKDLFADTQTYGTRLCSQSFDHIRTAVIDLNGPKNLKGIRLTPQQTEKPNDVTISLLQEDGSWKTYKKTSYGKKGTDVPVSSFLAGILKEGILTTKVRLEFESSLQNGITCECYGN